MRALLIFLLCSLFFQPFLVACGTHGLHTQSDIDNIFCTGISNDITIEQNSASSDHITNLNNLITIQTIGNDLIIRNNPMLTDISGLGNLASLGRDLIIENNPLLDECCALDMLLNLGTVGGRIIIRNNGTGNCNNDGTNITPCVPIPTLSQWGILFLSFVLIIFGLIAIKDKLHLSKQKA